MDIGIQQYKPLKIDSAVILLFIIAILVGSFLRISLMVIYPFVVIALCLFLKLRITNTILTLLIWIGFCAFLSLLNGVFLRYKLLSLYYMLPFVLFLFANPSESSLRKVDMVKIFFSCLSIIAIINDVVGYIQVIRYPDSDDSFRGIYSNFSVSFNGLVILNAILFFYYFSMNLRQPKKRYLIAAFFFMASSIMGFFGAGLIVILASFILTFFTPSLKSILKTFLITALSVTAVYFLLLNIKPNVLNYNLSNVKKIVKFDIEHGPRKVISFYNYLISYPKDVKDFLFGSGPGTFNSRSAFIVGSPSYFSGASFLKSSEQPYYFMNYSYPLWNETNTSQAQYLDGFRNQPFSSVLAFLGEYGIVFFFLLAGFYYKNYKTVSRLQHGSMDELAGIYFRIFKFLSILLPFLLLIDNFYEYPEMMLLIILCLKLLHIELKKRDQLQS